MPLYNPLKQLLTADPRFLESVDVISNLKKENKYE